MPELHLTRYKYLMDNIEAKLRPEDHARAAGFLHFCNEWDGLLIDKSDPEFDCCSCPFSDEFNPETGRLK